MTTPDCFFWDTITHSEPTLEHLVRTFGPDHVVIGTDYPFDMGMARPVAAVEALEGLDAGSQAAILGGNVTRLLAADPGASWRTV